MTIAEDTTRQHRKGSTRDARNLTLPIVSVIVVASVCLTAGATWATDRAELHANTRSVGDHDVRLRAVESAIIEQTTVQRGILKALESIERKMEQP